MTLESLTDLELMRRTARGQREAFAALVRRYQQSLVNYFRRMGARTDESEDLVQVTFLRVFAYRGRFRPVGKFTNFLYVLARHVWADSLRKAARSVRVDPHPVDDTPDPAALARADTRMDVQDALTKLSDKLREVVVLNVYQGLKYQEIADVLDIPLGTVKSRMHLAIRQLKEHFDVG